jgi:hypothetical protein
MVLRLRSGVFPDKDYTHSAYVIVMLSHALAAPLARLLSTPAVTTNSQLTRFTIDIHAIYYMDYYRPYLLYITPSSSWDRFASFLNTLDPFE